MKRQASEASRARRRADDELSWIEVLDRASAWDRIRQEPVGRVAYIEHDQPQIRPVNHTVDETSVVFRTATLFRGMPMPLPVTFEVDAYDRDAATGWSVIIDGELVRVTETAEVQACERTGLSPWAPGERDQWYRIVPARVTGRVIGRRKHSADGTYLPYMPPD